MGTTQKTIKQSFTREEALAVATRLGTSRMRT
jgi:hypothetical protein